MTDRQTTIPTAGYASRSVDDVLNATRRFKVEALVVIAPQSPGLASTQNSLLKLLRDKIDASGIDFHLAGRQLGVGSLAIRPSVPESSMNECAGHLRTGRFTQGIRQ